MFPLSRAACFYCISRDFSFSFFSLHLLHLLFFFLVFLFSYVLSHFLVIFFTLQPLTLFLSFFSLFLALFHLFSFSLKISICFCASTFCLNPSHTLSLLFLLLHSFSLSLSLYSPTPSFFSLSSHSFLSHEEEFSAHNLNFPYIIHHTPTPNTASILPYHKLISIYVALSGGYVDVYHSVLWVFVLKVEHSNLSPL